MVFIDSVSFYVFNPLRHVTSGLFQDIWTKIHLETHFHVQLWT